jgi:hypothetical protein
MRAACAEDEKTVEFFAVIRYLASFQEGLD